MSFANYKIAELWKCFMPQRNTIKNILNNDFITMAIYEPNHFSGIKPTNDFVKWAAVEVTSFNNIPADMETFVLTSGLYAVFDYKGLSTDNTIFEYIFGTWIPNSDFDLDNRPHVEILGKKHKNNDHNSEEEIWVPIKIKAN
jgi:AraC family transcriptional regulator